MQVANTSSDYMNNVISRVDKNFVYSQFCLLQQQEQCVGQASIASSKLLTTEPS